ncbi:hypothetical protein QT972_11040 [Microcoleus sp. herbarium7]|uniref:hypothetical protein n=1 Tax=Microcoleus sp. herbarium7 TaxID=3055435 RepID=UPI002FD19F1C
MLAQFQLNCLLSRFRSHLYSFNRKQVGTMFGILNALIYSAALNSEVAYRDAMNRRHFNLKDIDLFFEEARTVITPAEWISDYLKEHWAGLTRDSRSSVTKFRKIMCEMFKLFTLEDRHEMWKVATNRHRNPNPCEEFNMLLAMILARACEEYLITWGMQIEATELDMDAVREGKYEFVRIEDQSFPKHKAYTMARIGKAAGIWNDSQTPHPGLTELINIEYLKMKAEEQYQETEPEGRSPEQILEEEFIAITVPEIIISEEGTAVVTERIVDAAPLSVFVRLSMLVPPRFLLPKIDDGGILVPTWAREMGDKAMRWWQAQIDETEWMEQFAPTWVLDSLVCF